VPQIVKPIVHAGPRVVVDAEQPWRPATTARTRSVDEHHLRGLANMDRATSAVGEGWPERMASEGNTRPRATSFATCGNAMADSNDECEMP
jgi:hypothetical protein